MEKKASKDSRNENDVQQSVSSLYSALLNKRQMEKEAKREQKQAEKELRQQEEEEKITKEDGTKMTKKERRQAELDNWKEIVIGLTGDDLEYTSKKTKKKKYKKWINDEDENTVGLAKPQKKAKKRNYNKEFEPELNMLRTLVADQNKFTADLQKRFMNAAGPATKDAMFPNKTLVELAGAIQSGRSNSLGMLREIGSLKKTIADLYMKQKKMDSEISGSASVDTTDLGLMGSSLAASLFNNPNGNLAPSMAAGPTTNIGFDTPVYPQQTSAPQEISAPVIQAEVFDPSSWEGPKMVNDFASYENIPHEIFVEKNRTTGDVRWVAIRTDTNEEISGCNMPTSDPSKLSINEKDGIVRGMFDETYKLRIVG